MTSLASELTMRALPVIHSVSLFLVRCLNSLFQSRYSSLLSNFPDFLPIHRPDNPLILSNPSVIFPDPQILLHRN